MFYFEMSERLLFRYFTVRFIAHVISITEYSAFQKCCSLCWIVSAGLCCISFKEHSNFCSVVMSAFTAQKMKFSIKDFFSKCDQIRRFLQWLFFVIFDTVLGPKHLKQNFNSLRLFRLMFVCNICRGRLMSTVVVSFLGFLNIFLKIFWSFFLDLFSDSDCRGQVRIIEVFGRKIAVFSIWWIVFDVDWKTRSWLKMDLRAEYFVDWCLLTRWEKSTLCDVRILRCILIQYVNKRILLFCL